MIHLIMPTRSHPGWLEPPSEAPPPPHARTACHGVRGPAAASCSCPSLLSASSRLPVVSLRSVLSWPTVPPLDPLVSTSSPPAGSGHQARHRRAFAADAHSRPCALQRCAKACPDQGLQGPSDPRTVTHSHPAASRRTVRHHALVLHRSIDAPSPQVVWLVHLKHANARPISTSSCTLLSLLAYARRMGSMPPCPLVSYYIRPLRLSS